MTKETHTNESSTPYPTTATTTTKPSSSSSSSSSFTRAAIQGTLASLGFKILSFLCTQWTMRVLDPVILGQASVQLELLQTTVLFLSREGFRLALTTNRPKNSPRQKSPTSTTDADAPTATKADYSSTTISILVWLSVPVGMVMTGLAFLLFHIQTQPGFTNRDDSATTSPYYNDYYVAGILNCLACGIELLGEPAVLYSLREFQMTRKVSAESMATVSKTMATVVLLQYQQQQQQQKNNNTSNQQPWPVTAFGLAQIVYATVFTTSLYLQTWKTLPRPQWGFLFSSSSTSSSNQRERTPNPQSAKEEPGHTCSESSSSSSSSSPATVNNKNNNTVVVWSEMQHMGSFIVLLTLQGCFKHFLTEGDRIILTTMSKNYNQGVYAMGSSYGSLAARMLFQPLEENCRLLWSRLAAAADSTKSKRTRTTDTETNINDNDQQATAQTKSSATPASLQETTTNDSSSEAVEQETNSQTTTTTQLEESYTLVMKFVLYIGLLFSCLAVNYTELLLNILAGRKWGTNAEAIAVLSAFCVYTAFLAMNGTSEAFVYACCLTTGRDVGRLSLVHTLVGLSFAVTAPMAVRHSGTVGLVTMNCLAMALRSLYSVGIAVQYFAASTSSTTIRNPSLVSTLLRLGRAMVPHPLVLGAFAVSYVATSSSLQDMRRVATLEMISTGSIEWFQSSVRHVSVGISCGIGIVTLAYALERDVRRQLVRQQRTTPQK